MIMPNLDYPRMIAELDEMSAHVIRECSEPTFREAMKVVRALREAQAGLIALRRAEAALAPHQPSQRE